MALWSGGDMVRALGPSGFAILTLLQHNTERGGIRGHCRFCCAALVAETAFTMSPARVPRVHGGTSEEHDEASICVPWP